MVDKPVDNLHRNGATLIEWRNMVGNNQPTAALENATKSLT